ncbi:NmrA-like family protein [Thozetella sp. PMI_491]|nr:NmrA-like family protein [Thozetella sp. PMI_491]
MVVVAVAGGTGDMGRLIVAALLQRNQHEVYVLSRRYTPVVQTNYSSEEELKQLLVERKVHTVICTFAIDFENASSAQLRLIRAANAATCVQRFIPSEFNVDYDQGDDVLPYPEKRFHTVARRELEKTRLEFTYIYPGMFMDYYGMPHIETHLRQLPSMVQGNTAYIIGNGNTNIAMSYTKDVARYTALALELPKWPRVLSIVASTVTMNRLVELIERSTGRKLEVVHQSIAEAKKNPSMGLEASDPVVQQFPGGVEQLGALMVDLSASMEFGAYDFSKIESLDMVAEFEGKTEAPMRIEELLEMAWSGH